MYSNYQARWSYADVQIWPNEMGKPIAIGDWSKYLTTKFDIAESAAPAEATQSESAARRSRFMV